MIKKCEDPSTGVQLALGVLGVFVLLRILNYQKSLSDPLGSYIEFATVFLVTFYVFVADQRRLVFVPLRTRSGYESKFSISRKDADPRR